MQIIRFHDMTFLFIKAELMSSILKIVGWLFTWLRGRPNLRIRIIRDEPNEEIGGLKFEVENQANKPTSLKPLVVVNFLSYKGNPMEMGFDVREHDRLLPPFEPKLISASAKDIQPDRSHGWFRKYVFKPSNGPTAVVRIKDAYLEEIGGFLFMVEANWFRLTGKVKNNGSRSITECRAKERSRGPH